MAFLTHDHGGVVYHTSSVLDGSGLVHGFSTRLGGVSKGHFASLNLQKNGPEPDGWENVLENYRRFCEALGTDVRNVVRSKQVHEDTVRHVTEADRGKGLFAARDYTADALVTNEPGLNLMVFSADCIILLLHDPVTRSIGAVHAGWRGTALDLPARTAGEMGRLFGAKPENIRVAIGPGIGPCCFETYDDVPDAMRGAFGSGVEDYIRPRGAKWTVDLKGVNAWRLREAGVRPEHIDVCSDCTACHADLYWSHRVAGTKRGLQGALIGLRPEGTI